MSPIAKIPVAVLDGDVVLDSHSILTALLERAGPGALRVPKGSARIVEDNLVHTVDGALDAAIQLFYLQRRDAVRLDGVPFAVKHEQRIATALGFLAERCRGAALDGNEGIGLPEIALVTTCEWLRFRAAIDVERLAPFAGVEARFAGRASFVSTRPV